MKRENEGEWQLYTLSRAKIGVASGYYGGPDDRGACRGEVLWGLRLVEKLLPLLRQKPDFGVEPGIVGRQTQLQTISRGENSWKSVVDSS
jgi:hypothetical protein